MNFKRGVMMETIRVGSDYSIKIPSRFRSGLKAGQEVVVSQDEKGRLILTPIEQVRKVLKESFGMWAGRTDIPQDGVDYMDEIRKGNRLNDLGLRVNEAD
jgi:bifunctional DNA-binding transcriptional regulator/antitoxin component of YhaV-PrlF toxin-antitoxin module